MKIGEALKQMILQAHNFLQKHKNTVNDFIKKVGEVNTITQKTSWGLTIELKDKLEELTREGDSYCEIRLDPKKFHGWWKEMGNVTETFQASFYGLVLAFYPPRADKKGRLMIGIDRGTDFEKEDILFLALGETPAKALEDHAPILLPCCEKEKFAPNIILAKFLTRKDGDTVRFK